MQGRVLHILRSKVDWSDSIPVFRYVLGSAFIMAVTALLNYDLAYLTAACTRQVTTPTVASPGRPPRGWLAQQERERGPHTHTHTHTHD